MAGYRKKASYLVIGADAALTNRGISGDDLRWPSQISASGWDPSTGLDELAGGDKDFLEQQFAISTNQMYHFWEQR